MAVDGPLEGTAAFGPLLRQHRLAAGLSQEALAEATGLSARAIRALEGGQRLVPHRDTVRRLAEALHLVDGERARLDAAARRPLGSRSGARSTGAPPASPLSLSGALPMPPTPLIGREREVAALSAQLRRDDVRLVTLTGPAGTGKTRLAVAVAACLVDGFAQGVCFVDLAPVVDPLLVLSSIAATLHVGQAGRRPLSERVVEHLQDRHVLLVLDNFEQVLAAAPAVAELLAACGALKMIVTSRAALQLLWEHEFLVPPLALPDLAQRPALDALVATPAVALFVARSRAVQPDFELDEENAQAVAEICVRLDGLPLAIELAAARSKVIPPGAMLGRLERRLDLLTAGARDLPARQQTLRGAIGWSVSLLGPDDRTLFRRLGVFVGGCAPAAAAAVCASSGLDGRVADGLESLVNKSLLRVAPPAGGREVRLRMLETVREYALESLAASREEEALRRQHAAYYLDLAERAESGLTGAEQAVWLGRLEVEHDNLRAVLRYALEGGKAALGLRLGAVLWRFWWRRGYLAEGRQWLAALLALPDEQSYPREGARALLSAGLLALWQGDYSPARSLLETSLARGRALEDWRTVAYSLTFLSRVARDQGATAEARSLGEEGVARFRQVGDGWGLAVALHFLGLAILNQRQGANRAMARAYFSESRARFHDLGSWWDIAMPLRGLGSAAYLDGEYAESRRLFEQSMALFRVVEDEWSQAMVVHDLGHVALQQGDAQDAAARFASGLVAWRQLANHRGVALCLAGLAAVAAAERQAVRAARLFGAVEGMRDASGAVLEPTDRAGYDFHLAAAHYELDEAAFDAAWTEGRRMAPDEAIAYALAAMAPSLSVVPPIGAAGEHGDELDGLTPREREIVALIARGATNAQIAAKLIITRRTVETHVAHILGKLGVSTRTQVALLAGERGLLPARLA